MTAELPRSLLLLLHECIPTLQAAEVLLFLAAHPDRVWTAEEIVVAMRPTVITVPAVREYATRLTSAATIVEREERYRYGPATREIEETIALLAHAYNERPVTLIGAIYRIADSKIRSFSDSFRLRED
jgi:hypothetical protein